MDLMSRSLPRSTPSAHAVDPRGIAAFVDALEAAPNIEPHSIMLLRDGSVLAEGWWAPYAPDRVHLLYSLSKSFTAAAVGLAVGEGLLSLDDTVLSFFPELDAEITDPRTRRMRVRHLLAMASGHREETLDRAREADPANLVRGFFLVPPDEEPGAVFAYNQPCTYTLSVIVQRLAGSSLTEYLRPRLFEPLGIDDVGWIRFGGYEIGFSGLHAQTEAVAALGQLYLQNGSWGGRQLLPSWWVEEASRPHVANGSDPASDWEQGYGFQFWIARHGFRGDGAYGQFCVVLPEHGVVLAMTGQGEDMQGVLNLAWEHLLPAFGRPDGAVTAAVEDDAADAALAARLASLALSPIGGDPLNHHVESARFEPGQANALPRLSHVEVTAGAPWTLTLVEGSSRLDVTPGFGEWTTSGATAASAGWDEAGARLSVDLILLETPHRVHIVLDRSDSTFAARWETEPLHDAPLGSMHKPAPAPGA